MQPPVAFHFSVTFEGPDDSFDAAFQEVSGLDTTFEVEDVQEGGENRFVHKLPGPVKQSNIKLKRGMTQNGSVLAQWCQETIEGALDRPIAPKDLTISLRDADGVVRMRWGVTQAYPIKWSVDSFNAASNEIAIEEIELACQRVSRKT